MVYAKLSLDFTKRHASITEPVHVPNSNVYDISMVAGHKNLKTTQRYMHTADDRAHEAMAKLPKLATLRNRAWEDC